jgi:hypothetical protein
MAGIGTYVDVKFTPWIQFEGEGRWLRFNKPDGHLRGQLPDRPAPAHLPAALLARTPYAKVLIGYGKLNFEDNNGWGRYTNIAYGGGLDIKLTKRINLRLPDFELPAMAQWSEGAGKTYNLFPYGVSIGASYRFLGIK